MNEFHFSILAILYGSLVGLSLGLTGGGGAVIAIPLLIYGLDFPFPEATAVSLAVVGGTALYGAILQSFKGHVLWLVGAILGLGGIPTIYIGKWISDVLPQKVLLLSFAALMAFIALKMMFHKKLNGGSHAPTQMSNGNSWGQLNIKNIALLAFFGGVVGILSGTFGIGGGFFLVPILDLILRIPIEQATATSLVGIFLIAASGVYSNIDIFSFSETAIGVQFFLGSAGGMTVGAYTKDMLSARTLEIIFGCFVMALAAFVLLHNIAA